MSYRIVFWSAVGWVALCLAPYVYALNDLITAVLAIWLRVNLAGKTTAGVLKDVVLVKGFKKIEVDVTPAMEGLTLFHCHQQLHMDFGFMILFDYV